MKRSELKRKPWVRKPKTPPEKLVWKGVKLPGPDGGVAQSGEQGHLKARDAGSRPVASNKPKRPKSTPTRKAANGEACLVRLPGCGGADGTVVLAHYRLLPYCGTGYKPPDELGAFACDNCHGIVDGRKERPMGWSFEAVRLAHAEGVMRTQLRLKELREAA